MTRILFIDPNNGHFTSKSYVAVDGKLTKKQCEIYENNQPGLLRMGGDWQRILRLSEFKWRLTHEVKVDFTYKLVSGNY